MSSPEFSRSFRKLWKWFKSFSILTWSTFRCSSADKTFLFAPLSGICLSRFLAIAAKSQANSLSKSGCSGFTSLFTLSSATLLFSKRFLTIFPKTSRQTRIFTEKQASNFTTFVDLPRKPCLRDSSRLLIGRSQNCCPAIGQSDSFHDLKPFSNISKEIDFVTKHNYFVTNFLLNGSRIEISCSAQYSEKFKRCFATIYGIIVYFFISKLSKNYVIVLRSSL